MENYEYKIPEPDKIIVDSETQEVIDKTNLSPIDKIKLAAKLNNIDINEPNPKCKKCFGRGYISIKVDNQEPIPCLCLFNLTKEEKIQTNSQFNSNVKMNRSDRRKFEKRMRNVGRKVLNEVKNKKG